MPRADYECLTCLAIVEDHTFRAAIGARLDAPNCPECGRVMDWIPAARFDLLSDGGTDKSFQKFRVNVNGGEIEIDSIHKARQIEQESEQRYRDGEGEPIRFRMLNQDRSNKDVNSFGETGTIGSLQYSSGQAPQKKAAIGVKRHGTEKPKVATGPGVVRKGISALKGG